jgi:hypothetical protein
MKVYKFRSLNNIEFVKDIFCNHRFYASYFYELDDPSEGGNYILENDTRQSFHDEMKQYRKNIRICSFSKEYGNQLMWAYYADKFNGLCVEVELGDIWPGCEVVPVDYNSDFLPYFSDEMKDWIFSFPRQVFRIKNKVWKYQTEIRVLTTEKYIEGNNCIKAVYMGIRISDSMRDTILKMIPQHIKVFKTKISDKTYRVIRDKRLR